MERDCLTDPEMLRCYISKRFGIEISKSDSIRIVKLCNEQLVTSDRYGWFNQRNTDMSVGPIAWIMSRLREFRYFVAGMKGQPEIHFTCEMHCYPLEEGTIPYSFQDMKEATLHLTVRRSPLSRVSLSDSEPIDRVARRVSGEGGKPCPYCRKYFRNPAAMVLHLKESHFEKL